MSLEVSLLPPLAPHSPPTTPNPESRETYMAKWSRRRVKAALAFLSLFLVLGVAYIGYKAFTLLSSLVTTPGAAIVSLCLLLVLLRVSLETLAFPGSLTLWRRSIESQFCKEMATQALLRVKDLRNALEALSELSTDRGKSKFLPRSLATSMYAKRTIAGLIGTFVDLREEGVILKDQKRLLDVMEELREGLANTKLIVGGKDTPLALWDWIDSFSNESISLSSPEDLIRLSASLEVCRRLESILYRSCGHVSFYSRTKRWLSDTTLGHINQMRADLLSRFHGEQVWVDTSDGVRIDCIWVPGGPSDSPTILFCNPNGGFYEFACYQSEWLEYYNKAGINVMMWNYRGYGRTKGRPTPAALKKDGVAIAEYLKTVRRVGLLGVHGESMGGMVAAHIARKVGVDLLIADRTFASLDAVALFNFGAVAYRVYQILTWWQTDTVEDYLHTSCYKVVSADPNDSMISDCASLKSGTALRLLSSHYSQPPSLLRRGFFHILNDAETEELREALCRFVKVVLYFNKRDGERSPRSVGTMIQGLSQISGQSNYQMLGPDTDAVLEDESLLATIYRLYGLIDNFNAGGKPLTSIPQHSDSLKQIKATADSLQLWLAVLDIWGCFSREGEMTDTRAYAVERARETIEGLETICEENRMVANPLLVQLFAQARTISRYIGKVRDYLEETSPESPSGKSASSGSTLPEKTSSKVTHDWKAAGYLVPVSCGHSGPMSSQEKGLLEAHLVRAQFLK